jgi:alkylation response protein AidB-like acyl-CoA dehydrogenase
MQYPAIEFDGVEIAENWNMVGMRATESHDLVLNDVWVPKDNLLPVNQLHMQRQYNVSMLYSLM